MVLLNRPPFPVLFIIAILHLCGARTLRERLQRNPRLPPAESGQPLRVLAGIYIESLGNFRAAEMSFDVDLYLYLNWRDASLTNSDAEYVLLNDPKIRHYIWMPDLYFANARTSRFHEVMAPNMNLFVDRNGSIAYSTRITLSVACNLELSLYPMDSQKCVIQMLSYAYIEKQVKVRWFESIDATRYNPGIQLPEFRISNITNEYCNGTYNYAIMEDSHKKDEFSCLEAIIHLNRQIGYHVVQSFIPTGLIVMISWVSFWIDRRAVPARVTLSFTTLLSLSTLGNGLRFGLPQVAYAKAIDYWFGACMFFVFLSLVEFAAVNSYMREAEKYERFATYSAKKDSGDFCKAGSPKSVRGPKRGQEEGQEEGLLAEKASARSTLAGGSDLPSIDATPAEESESADDTAVKWSSAATVGDNPIWFKYSVCGLGTSPLHNRDRHNRNCASVQRPATTAVRGCEHLPKQNQSSGECYKVRKSETRSLNRIGGNPMATNHFLREGFRYSRKGLSIDQNSRWLFPLAFALWNAFYWGYYLWWKQHAE